MGKDKSKELHVGVVKDMLMSHADACMQLAETLSGSGRDPLNANEKQLVRSALLPAIKESMRIMQSAYVIGDIEWMERENDRLHDLMRFPRN
jgi:hypothetical protein